MKQWFDKLSHLLKKKRHNDQTIDQENESQVAKHKTAEPNEGNSNAAKKTIKDPDSGLNKNEKKPKAKDKANKKAWSKKKKIAVISLSIVFVLLLSGVAYGYSIWSNPMGQFENVAQQTTPTPKPTQAEPTNTDAPPTPTPTINPYDALVNQADFSMLDNIVNIMLIGVDYAKERDEWSGKHAFHSDVMIVLSINTDTNEVDLISLPRDTYANIPGVDGIYKLNASIDCGGEWPTEEGFNKVCEAASWMLGGMPVHYYYAVDMGAVKGLVNAIDGLYYDIEMPFKIQGRSYETGNQLMDGQAVLDYMRVRKNLGKVSGDLHRINRQKNMLVAIFNKLKESGMLLKLPDILSAFDGNLYTNTSLSQTAGLAAFMYKINAEDIEMHSMDGRYKNIFNWNFVITDQKKRVNLIDEVYGVEVPQYKNYTYLYATTLWQEMQAEDFSKKASSVLKKVKAILDEDALLPPYPTPKPKEEAPTPENPSENPTDPENPNPEEPTPTPEPTPEPTPVPSDGYRKYDNNVREFYNQVENLRVKVKNWDTRPRKQSNTDKLEEAINQLKADVDKLCDMFSIKKIRWRVNYEKEDNEIYIDFN